MILPYLYVAFGGAIGSVLRYSIQLNVARQDQPPFPFATFLVNALGSFLIGWVYAVSEKTGLLSPEFRIFLATGFCGGFTTFSAFSYESLAFLRAGEYHSFLFYSFATFALCLFGTAFGIWLGSFLKSF
ncbi:fluoride efflux transporter CrcB [Leptospira fletcheri]|uniref:Fluoride-specific ion channel FluC n=1 Tax=Leptospira fletcheri TaxID=2484981 RepID=A0A4R9GJU1_9LEPT|nr:fluoride efflux transporter CrcB [Leptospira fletcheri]TGK14002.1 fluoride efflux transporter CrcB [Leptospira fletcheri]